jgi:hypothetical protein
MAGSLVSLCRYKKFWSCTGCSSQPRKTFFSLPYTISHLLSPSPSKLGRQSCRVACLLICVSVLPYPSSFWLRNNVNYGIGLSYGPARQHRLVGLYVRQPCAGVDIISQSWIYEFVYSFELCRAWMKEVKGIRHGGGGAYLRCRSLPQYVSAFATRVLLSTYKCVKGEKAWGRIFKL